MSIIIVLSTTQILYTSMREGRYNIEAHPRKSISTLSCQQQATAYKLPPVMSFVDDAVLPAASLARCTY